MKKALCVVGAIIGAPVVLGLFFLLLLVLSSGADMLGSFVYTLFTGDPDPSEYDRFGAALGSLVVITLWTIIGFGLYGWCREHHD